MEWPEDLVRRFRELWDDPSKLSITQIGEMLGVSRNAVAGKRRRLHLPTRGSPLRPKGSGERPGGKRPAREVVTLPDLPSLQPPSPPETKVWVPKPVSVPRITRRASIPKAPRPAPPAPTPPTQGPPAATNMLIEPNNPPEPKQGAVRPCCWPMNSGRPWRFCGEECESDKPYCSDHVKDAYIRVRDRREDNPSAFSYTKWKAA